MVVAKEFDSTTFFLSGNQLQLVYLKDLYLDPSYSIFFINDLNDLISTMSLRLYANDTTEYYTNHSSMVLNYTINKELNAIKEWVTVNHLSINTVKTQAHVTYKYELWLAILLWK